MSARRWLLVAATAPLLAVPAVASANHVSIPNGSCLTHPDGWPATQHWAWNFEGPEWSDARNPDCVTYTYDHAGAELAASNRVLLALGFGAVALPLYALVVMSAARAVRG